jgi:hypothetical protein
MHAHHFLEEQNYRLADIVSKPGDAFRYVYDLGDQFVHLMTLQEIVPGDNTFELIDVRLRGRPRTLVVSRAKATWATNSSSAL